MSDDNPICSVFSGVNGRVSVSLPVPNLLPRLHPNKPIIAGVWVARAWNSRIVATCEEPRRGVHFSGKWIQRLSRSINSHPCRPVQRTRPQRTMRMGMGLWRCRKRQNHLTPSCPTMTVRPSCLGPTLTRHSAIPCSRRADDAAYSDGCINSCVWVSKLGAARRPASHVVGYVECRDTLG